MVNPNKGLKPDIVSHLLRVAAPVEKRLQEDTGLPGMVELDQALSVTSHNRGP